MRIDQWQPGAHRVSARWGAGTVQFTIDDAPPIGETLGNIRLAAGSDVIVGAPDSSGTTFRAIEFVGSPPAD